ncbi:MAG TPA: prepilin-type N-terminal cleavage/methylation domain-containing protein [Armatimonadota bacterium]|jgi:prepilin-type N-terminal cleavage/methylation domain-containing protein
MITHQHSRKQTRAFTLIELLIVIVVIAILATIVIPRLMGATRRSREANFIANLNHVRYAVERFQADTGMFPLVLRDIAALDFQSLVTPVPVGTFRGAYISTEGGITGNGLPLNPFVDPSDTNDADHWKYDTATGKVTAPDALANIPLTDGRTLGQL